MAAIDPIHMSILSKVFPETNDAKVEVFTLFAYGMSKKDIAHFRGTTPQAVSKALKELCEQYDVTSQDALKAVFSARLSLYAQLGFRLDVVRS